MEGSVSFTQQPIVTKADSQIYVWMTRVYVQLSSLPHTRWWLIFFHRQFVQPIRTATHPTHWYIMWIYSYVKQQHPFYIDAIVILPEHLHCLLTLAEGGGMMIMQKVGVRLQNYFPNKYHWLNTALIPPSNATFILSITQKLLPQDVAKNATRKDCCAATRVFVIFLILNFHFYPKN